MVEVETYIKLNDNFIKLSEFNNILPEEDNYVDGAIVLNVNGKEVLTFQHYDYIFLLWGFIVDGISKTNLIDEAIIGFPDQPSEIKFIPSAQDRVKIYIDDNMVTSIERLELLNALRNEAKLVFEKLISLNPSRKNHYLKDISVIDKIKI